MHLYYWKLINTILNHGTKHAGYAGGITTRGEDFEGHSNVAISDMRKGIELCCVRDNKQI